LGLLGLGNRRDGHIVTTYRIRVNGHLYTVEIDDLAASPVKVSVNGRLFEVSIDQQGVRSVEPPARVRTTKAPRDELLLDAYVPAVASTYVEIEPEPEPTDTRPSSASPSTERAEAVTAPMPGTILDIAVEAGDIVQQGDTLCNLEAMKMKSPIRAPGPGTVQQVLISEGQNVAFGEALFMLR
jgi:biotin carboxyl carrier protein